MDYRSVGFRECAAEVARYLVSVEGMDLQDPLRLRLMSHLQCYSAQREAAAKHSLGNSFQGGGWNSVGSHPGLASQYGSGPGVGSMPPHPAPMISQHTTQTDQLSLGGAGLSSVTCADPSRIHHAQLPGDNTMRLTTTGSVAAPQVPSVSSSGAPQVSLHSQFPGVPSQFPVSLSVNSMPMLSPSGHHYNSTAMSALGQSGKPYRPWGAELAYWQQGV